LKTHVPVCILGFSFRHTCNLIVCFLLLLLLTHTSSSSSASFQANLAINMQVQNPMGLPVLFNAPNQLLLQQHMVQQMSQRGSGGFPAEMYVVFVRAIFI
jgi:hypothetical protein